MKTIIYFCFFIFTFCLGCGSDNPVNNNPNPPSDPVVDTISLFAKDSIYFNQSFPEQFASTNYLSTVQVDTLRVEFSYHIYGIRSKLTYAIDGDTILNYQRNISSNTSFDTTFTSVFIVNKINFNNLLSIYPNSSFFNGNEFASLKNIKLWYIRRS